MELVKLPNCQGLSENGKCNWLSIGTCVGEECVFKRSASEHVSSGIKTFNRLASLASVEQARIADKYYNGMKPWEK